MTHPFTFAHRALASDRRRHVITSLRAMDDDSVTLDELVEEVVQGETHSPNLDELVEEVVQGETHSPNPDPESVATDLYHVQLPMLDDNGVVDFDADSKIVQYHNPPEIETLLDAED